MAASHRVAAASPAPHRPVALWLLACCALVFCMVVVGGVTRLTHSGLSIVEWQPLLGAILLLVGFALVGFGATIQDSGADRGQGGQ
jgi:hypothetical protein